MKEKILDLVSDCVNDLFCHEDDFGTFEEALENGDVTIDELVELVE